MSKRRILYVPIDDLAPALRNPKRHDPDAVRASIARFGFMEPIVRDDRTDRLVAGHGRVETLAALQALDARPEWWPPEKGWPPDGVNVVKGRWHVPVVVGWNSVDDDEAHAAGVALNRVGEGLWDDRDLAGLLSDLRDGAGLEGTGYSDEALNLLLAELAERPEPTPPGEFPEYGDDIATEHECPRCGYAWSGTSKPSAPAEAGAPA